MTQQTQAVSSSAAPDAFAAVVFLFHFIPKNLISFLTGAVVRIKWPKPMAEILNKGFVKVFGINMKEAKLEIGDFDCIEAVFTRALKEGLRPTESEYCSPADGFLAFSKPLANNLAIQAKGLNYSALDLVFGESADPKEGRYDWFTTVYLAPHNYHRVHSPVSGKLINIRYIPGELWPVNVPFVSRLPRLFVRNERLSFDIDCGEGKLVHVVMVGALNVGRIETEFLGQEVTNSWARQFGASPKSYPQKPDTIIKAGDELGTFMLGSTVVIVLNDKAAKSFNLKEASGNKPIKLGRTLLKDD